MAKTQILEYYVHLRDGDVVRQWNQFIAERNSRPWPNGAGGLIELPGGQEALVRAPFGMQSEAASNVGAGGSLPIIEVGGALPLGGDGYLTSPWFTTSNTFNRGVSTFQRSSGWWIFGSTTRFYWVARIVHAPLVLTTGSPVGDEPTEAAFLPQRRRIFGFELGGLGELSGPAGNEGAAPGLHSRDAARAIDGWGFPLRANGTTGDSARQGNPTGGTHYASSWDRGYVRLRHLGDSTTEIYRCETLATNGVGFSVAVTASGQLALMSNSGAGVGNRSLVSTTSDVLALDTWYRLDILTFWDAAGNAASIIVYLAGVVVLTGSRSIGGTQANRWHLRSEWGKVLTGTDSGGGFVIDFDDCMQADCPKDKDLLVAAWSNVADYAVNDYVRHGGGAYRAVVASGPGNGGAVTPGADPEVWIRQTHSIDWLRGSRMQLIRGVAFGPNHGAWSGDVRELAMRPRVNETGGPTSSTSGDLLEVETDAEVVCGRPGVLGMAGMQVCGYQLRGSTGSGSLGYQIGAETPADVSITQAVGLQWNSVIWAPTLQPEPVPLAAIRLRHTKAADTNAARIKALVGVVELIGTFGPEDPFLEADEDAPEPAPIPAGRTLHNAPWPLSPWADSGLPLGPVIILAGTYTGNGTGQSLAFPAPPAWIWVRPLTGGAGVGQWSAGMLAQHKLQALSVGLTGFTNWRQNLAYVPSSEDADQQTEWLVDVAGADAQWNANTVVYQYVAFCDPAARFCRAGAVAINSDEAPWSHALPDPEFLAEWAFINREQIGTTTTANELVKGPGNSADGASLITSGTNISAAATFASGLLDALGAGLLTGVDQYAYTLWRRADGNNDPNQARVMAIGSYTGDGSASRTINIAPASGRRPLFCVVTPIAAAASIARDPSHTTNTSQSVASGSTTATGITAGGIDQFTVGSTLNGNGVVYQYFCLMGSADAGNGGWSTQGTFVPVAADSPNPSDWTEPVLIPEIDDTDEPTEPDPNDPGELTTDIAENCLAASTRVCNLALSRIGVTDRLASLADDDSVAAEQCRLIYKTEIDATLRAYDWHFATAYAQPVLVDGALSDPVNPDWVYSYREPSDSVKVRRIVNPRSRRTFDPDPPHFDKSSDANGQLIFTNEPGDKIDPEEPLTIEYTRRLDCPASRGDAIFRSCAAWRLAAALAIPLGRDEKAAKWALANFAAELPVARVVSRNEQERVDKGQDAEPDWLRGR